MPLYRDAIRRFRDLGMRFELARALVDAAVGLGLHEPDGRAAADEAHAILQGLGATAYLARMDALLEATAGRAGSRASPERSAQPGPERAVAPTDS